MVVHQIPGLGGGVGLSHLPQAPEEDKEAGEEVGEEKKDVIIEVLGDIGRYQLLVGLLFALLEIPHGWCMLLHKFISPKTNKKLTNKKYRELFSNYILQGPVFYSSFFNLLHSHRGLFCLPSFLRPS
ncbi:uncharacterized protein LOC111707920 isoform X2 [Eurytemora carolleeae]|uniref:uncharacterized protein LOC111707920 isoform X2 n=1 Tax=Eurytemora carolleeae TaxID=1294199 RepID=UPI000C77E4A0|nr:uncharacterized protein LOC111707920 isoform X2 [Eurytemora carolleeae]|eukprot:XP_023336876.1 uncharacterized protein LOC111707920 isoform X2 [Eurytemora affinis]